MIVVVAFCSCEKEALPTIENKNTNLETVSAVEALSVLNTLITHSVSFLDTNYNKQETNCTSFAVSAANIIGFDVPISECIGTYGVGQSGATPARLGGFMRDMSLPIGASRNAIGGNAPISNECP